MMYYHLYDLRRMFYVRLFHFLIGLLLIRQDGFLNICFN